MLILDNPKRFAKLLASLNVPGSNRPLSPVEVANEINVLRDDLGGDIKEVIKRLPVSEYIVKEFLCLTRLPTRIQGIVVWGESSKKDGAIGFSVAAKMARLDNQNDMLKLAGTILDMTRPVTKEEIKGILSLKKRMSSKSIDDCMEEVLNVTRTITVNHFLFITGIKPNTIAMLSKGGQNKHAKALDILKGVFPEETLNSVTVSTDHIRLALDEEGWKFIAIYAKQHNLSRNDVVNHMIESEGSINDNK